MHWNSVKKILENIVTTQIKYLPTNLNVICPYFDTLSKVKYFLLLNGNKFFLFSLMADHR